jgi:hypothetical protein
MTKKLTNGRSMSGTSGTVILIHKESEKESKFKKTSTRLVNKNDLITQERLRLCEKSDNEKKYLNR